MPSKPGELARLVAVRGVRDERVLAAVRAVPRGAFAPPAERERAYEDEPLSIGHGQVTSQPSLIATMVEALALSGDERVLEVGTGLGWQTALLGRLAREVWSVEYRAKLAAAAQKNLVGAGVENAHVIVADGSEGLPEHAPFDAIVVAAAHPSVPPPLAEKLTPGGRLVQPLGSGGEEEVVLFERAPDGLARRRRLLGARFVRLHGRHGLGK